MPTSYQMSNYAGQANRIVIVEVSDSPGTATIDVKADNGIATTSKWVGEVDKFGKCAKAANACKNCPGFKALELEKQMQSKGKPFCNGFCGGQKLQQGETMARCKQCNYLVCSICINGFQFQVPEQGAKEMAIKCTNPQGAITQTHTKFSTWVIQKAVGDGADDGSGGIAGLTDLFSQFGLEKDKMPKAIAFCKQQSAHSIQEVAQFGGAEDFATALDLPKIKQAKLVKHMYITQSKQQ